MWSRLRGTTARISSGSKRPTIVISHLAQTTITYGIRPADSYYSPASFSWPEKVSFLIKILYSHNSGSPSRRLVSSVLYCDLCTLRRQTARAVYFRFAFFAPQTRPHRKSNYKHQCTKPRCPSSSSPATQRVSSEWYMAPPAAAAAAQLRRLRGVLLSRADAAKPSTLSALPRP